MFLKDLANLRNSNIQGSVKDEIVKNSKRAVRAILLNMKEKEWDEYLNFNMCRYDGSGTVSIFYKNEKGQLKYETVRERTVNAMTNKGLLERVEGTYKSGMDRSHRGYRRYYWANWKIKPTQLFFDLFVEKKT